MFETLIADAGKDPASYDIAALAEMDIQAMSDSMFDYPGIEQMLETLRSKGYTLALLSNCAENGEVAVQRRPWSKHVNHIVFSYKTGTTKPDPAIYRLAVEKTGFTPQECLFVGDGDFKELDGAARAGLVTVKVTQTQQSPSSERSKVSDFQIDSVTDLPALLEKLGGPKRVLDWNEAEALWESVKARDEFIAEHCRRVSTLLAEFAHDVLVDAKEIEDIRMAGLLHDIGKLELPDELFSKLKNGDPLSEEEIRIVREHAGRVRLLAPFDKVPRAVSDALRFHHERFNGSGYPYGLSGTEIPKGVRMLSIVDYYDAIVFQREWKTPQLQRPLGRTDAIRLLIEEATVRFDPGILKRFLSFLKKTEMAQTP
jgi:HAD superfamily hydrolase (TIGR01509 family)